MPKDPRIKKVLVIGSGPIIIGQAAEFDYSGTQACRALKSEGVETVLVNSNPATIMTDPDIADHVYIEPLTAEVIERIIEKEKPDAILPNLGGQMGLNLSMELARNGFLDRSGVRLLACKPDTIDRAEDRQLFKDTMEKLHQPIIPSKVVEDLDDALDFAEVIGYPVIVRPAFTMGGTGGGICEDREKLHEIATNGLRLSPIHQILVEKCISGWKEIEFEVVRDKLGNVIAVCSMENIDPVGACVGTRGARVGAVVNELHGEKMDIIVWSEDPAKFVAAALSPADVKSVTLLPGSTKACRVIVPDDQLSLAIGKEGQNARLAARLTGYKIDIKPASQEQELEAIDAQPDEAPEDAEPQA